MPPLTEMLEGLSGGSGVPRRLDAGEMLFTTGDPVRSLFVLEKGQLRLLRHTAFGATLTLHVARTGEAFAEASLFSQTYHCDAAADVGSTVMAYPKRTLLTALCEDPGAALALTGHLARQVHMLRSQIELLNSISPIFGTETADHRRRNLPMRICPWQRAPLVVSPPHHLGGIIADYPDSRRPLITIGRPVDLSTPRTLLP